MDSTPKVFSCDVCPQTFTVRSNLSRHKRVFHGGVQYPCDQCGVVFNRADNLAVHKQTCKLRKRKGIEGNSPTPAKASVGKCNWCGQVKMLLPSKPFCSTCADQGRECNQCHRPMSERFFGEKINTCNSCCKKSKPQQSGGRKKKEALNKTVTSHSLKVNSGLDLLETLTEKEEDIANILEEELDEKNGVKWYITVKIRFTKENQAGEQVSSEPVFRSTVETLMNLTGLKEVIADAYQQLHGHFQEFQREGSGWNIDQVLQLQVHTVQYQPLMGSSYIPLPEFIQKKKAVLNIKNQDQKCFVWSILAALYPVGWGRSPARLGHYIPHLKDIDLTGIEFPTPISQIPRFEKQNGISVNVFAYEKEFFPIYITKERCDRHVNLLLINHGEQRHFCLIHSLSRLLVDRTHHNGQTHYCNYCLHGFTSEDLLTKHVPLCSPHGPQKIKLPTEDEKIYFKNTFKQLRVPFVVYADFESYTSKLEEEENTTEESNTHKYQRHKPSGFCYMVVSEVGQYCKTPVVYRGDKVVETFLEKLMEEEREIVSILKEVKPMNLSPEEEDQFQNAQNCHICRELLGAERARDHCHLTGK